MATATINGVVVTGTPKEIAEIIQLLEVKISHTPPYEITCGTYEGARRDGKWITIA